CGPARSKNEATGTARSRRPPTVNYVGVPPYGIGPNFGLPCSRLRFGHTGTRRCPMLTQSISSSSPIARKVTSVPGVATDRFGLLTGHAGLVATEFTYRKDEEIYGEDEPAEYVYQVIRGAVRTYKLLSDGRRQIGAFHLPGDVFGLESGVAHRLAAEAILDTTLRL